MKMFYLLSQHSEEMYDPEIYRHQIAEYYNPYVLDPDIQAGEFYSNVSFFTTNTVSIETTTFSIKLL